MDLSIDRIVQGALGGIVAAGICEAGSGIKHWWCSSRGLQDQKYKVALLQQDCGGLNTDEKTRENVLEMLVRAKTEEPVLYPKYMERFGQCFDKGSVLTSYRLQDQRYKAALLKQDCGGLGSDTATRKKVLEMLERTKTEEPALHSHYEERFKKCFSKEKL